MKEDIINLQYKMRKGKKTRKIQLQNLVKELPQQKNITYNSKPTTWNDKQEVETSSLQDSLALSNNHNSNKINYDFQHIEIDTSKQPIPTQNIPIALPVPEINRIYISVNIFLCLMYLLTGLICSQTLFAFTSMNANSVPVIVIVCLTFVVYAIYVLLTIKYSHIKIFVRKLETLTGFQTFFHQIKEAKTWFQAQLLGDRNSWDQKEEIRQLIYEAKVIDKSGKFYALPQVISYINAHPQKSKDSLGQSTNNKDQQMANNQKQQMANNQKQQMANNQKQQMANNQKQQKHINSQSLTKTQFNGDKNQPYQFITIVIAEYQKKYYFASQSAKIDYLNKVQQFFCQNNQMFDWKKPLKGYKKIDFIVNEFENKRAYLMVASQKSKDKIQNKVNKNNESVENIKNLDKLNNQSILNLNDSNSLRILQDDEVKHQPPPEGLIYKQNKISIQQKPINMKKLSPQSQPIIQPPKDKTKYQTVFVVLFMAMYWICLILGLGAFYEWIVMKKFVKCIRVTITKEIHHQLLSQQINDQILSKQ